VDHPARKKAREDSGSRTIGNWDAARGRKGGGELRSKEDNGEEGGSQNRQRLLREGEKGVPVGGGKKKDHFVRVKAET